MWSVLQRFSKSVIAFAAHGPAHVGSKIHFYFTMRTSDFNFNTYTQGAIVKFENFLILIWEALKNYL